MGRIVDCSIVGVLCSAVVLFVAHCYFEKINLVIEGRLDLPIVLNVSLEGVPQVVQMACRFYC